MLSMPIQLLQGVKVFIPLFNNSDYRETINFNYLLLFIFQGVDSLDI